MTETALAVYEPGQLNLIKQTVAKGVTDLELELFLYQAKRTGLDPLSKQIHAIKRWNKGLGREEMAIQTGIDGYRLIADRTGKLAGIDDPVFDNEDSPKKATVTVYKIVDGIKCAFTASARWKEYYPGEKQGFMWNNKPCIMLGKCAEALALRKGFPQELSGVYTHEEMQQADKDVVPIQEEAKPEPVKAKKHTKNDVFKKLQDLGYTVQEMKDLALEKVGKAESKSWTQEDIDTLMAYEVEPPEERTPGEDDN